MKQLVIDAPCKINLTLDIVGRRPNGYHEMDMVMQSVGLCDHITIEKNDFSNITMSSSHETLPCDDSNIMMRCAKLFFERTSLSPSVHLHLDKHIPMLAGLGGGSADGAAVLVGLNRLYDAGLSVEEMCRLGFDCGADIPFCIRGGTLRVQGAGEMLSEAPDFPRNCWIVLAKPRFCVSTRLAFEGFDAQAEVIHGDTELMLRALETHDLKEISSALFNAFEPFCEPRAIEAIEQVMLANGAQGALMSGSGSAVFGLFDKKEAAQRCAQSLRPLMEQVDVVQPVDHGPLVLCEET